MYAASVVPQLNPRGVRKTPHKIKWLFNELYGKLAALKTRIFYNFSFFILQWHFSKTSTSPPSLIQSFSCSKRKIKNPDQHSFHLHDSKACQHSVRLLVLHCTSRQFWTCYSLNVNHKCLFTESQSLGFSASDSPFEKYDSSPYHNESIYAWHSPATMLALMQTLCRNSSRAAAPVRSNFGGVRYFSPFPAGGLLIPTSEASSLGSCPNPPESQRKRQAELPQSKVLIKRISHVAVRRWSPYSSAARKDGRVCEGSWITQTHLSLFLSL